MRDGDLRETFETDFGSAELEHWNPRKGSGLEIKVGKSLSGVGGVFKPRV